MCQPIPDFATRQIQARNRYIDLKPLLSAQIVPKVPNQPNVVDGIVAAALGFPDDQQRFRVERGLNICNREQIEVALMRLDCLLGLVRAYAAYAEHQAFTRRRGWFVRLLRRP